MFTLNSELFIDCRCTLAEGPVWDTRRRALLWTDIERSTLWMHDGAGTRSWHLPDRLGSLVLCESGRLLLALASGLFLGDIDETSDGDLPVRPLVEVQHNVASGRTNDGRTDRSGNFVFGTYNDEKDGPSGSFYQYSKRHGLRRLDLGNVTIANSICFAADGRTMYFCDSPLGAIMRCNYDADAARVANVRQFVRFGPNDGLPDGSVIDAEDCLWNAAWGVGRVRRYSPDGRVIREVHVAAKNTTCPVFGGDALDQLFVTSARQEMTSEELDAVPHAGGIYRCTTAGVRGLLDPSFAGL